MPAVLEPAEKHSLSANKIISALDVRVTAVASKVKQSEVWRTLREDESHVVKAMLREIMLAVYWYQPHTTEAGFHMLGRLPKDSGKILTVLLAHKADEAEHGLWAKRDYLALGGELEIAEGPPSPATFAVRSVWWSLARDEDPFGYLGAEYLFEYLTAVLAPEVLDILSSRGIDATKLGFLRDHATEDVAHTELLRATIARAIDRYPDKVETMERSFDYFAQVYPLPVWLEALDRARDK